MEKQTNANLLGKIIDMFHTLESGNLTRLERRLADALIAGGRLIERDGRFIDVRVAELRAKQLKS
jgi:hypothetical protein